MMSTACSSRIHASNLDFLRVILSALLLLLFSSHSIAAQITLAWDPSPDQRVIGYRVHAGQASGSYSLSFDTGTTTSYTIKDLAEGGIYYFAVSARDSTGAESAFSNQVSATIPYSPPTADFSTITVTGIAPLSVNFSSATTGTVTSYSWSFGDGSTSTQQNPAHTYAAAGSYTVSLTVTGPGGQKTTTKQSYINVANPAPTASFTATPTAGVAPLTVSFKNTSSGAITSYLWDFGNGQSGVLANPSISYATPGTYSVKLTAIGPGGSNTALKSAYIIVSPTTNLAPNGTILQPSGPVTIVQGQTVSFAATGSDPDNNAPLRYTWDFGGGAPSSNIQNPTIAFSAIGTYAVKLTVTDAYGKADATPATTTVTVVAPTNQPPDGRILSPNTTITVAQGQSISFQGSGTDPDNNVPLSYAWDFAGGAVAAAAQNPTVTFNTAGTYTARLTVRDAKGLADPTPATVSISVLAPPPIGAVSTQTLWSESAAPKDPTDPDTNSVNLGVKFKSDVAGYVTGIRFYKGPENTGAHIASLWTRRGQLLATAKFANETSSGWQQVKFAVPVRIAANTIYIASYLAPNGKYANDDDYFATAGVDSGTLHALRNGAAGGNGVYRYSSTTAFPNSSYRATNYWVDVMFQPAP